MPQVTSSTNASPSPIYENLPPRTAQEKPGANLFGNDAMKIVQAADEYRRLTMMTNRDFSDMVDKVIDLTNAAHKDDKKIFGSGVLYKILETVAGAMEKVCSMSKGRLSDKLLHYTPLARQMDEQSRTLESLSKEFMSLHLLIKEAREKNIDLEAGPYILEQLDRVDESLRAFRSAIDYRDAETEEVTGKLRGLNDLADSISEHVAHYRDTVENPGKHLDSIFERIPELHEILETGKVPESRAGEVQAAPPPAPEAAAAPVSTPAREPVPETAVREPPGLALRKAPRTYRGKPTPGKPKGNSPKFYCEKQQSRLCAKHALNAFIGGPVINASDLAAVHHEQIIANMEKTIKGKIKAGHGVRSIAKENCISVNECRRLIEEHGPDRAPRKIAEAYVEVMRQLVPDEYDSGQSVVQGNLIELSMKAINSRKEDLGLPDAEFQEFKWNASEEDITGFIEQRQAQTDRIVIGSGAHYFAYRKAENGRWYRLDSISGQKAESPAAYVRQRIQNENRAPGLRRMELPRFEFVSYPEEVRPKFMDAMPAGANRV